VSFDAKNFRNLVIQRPQVTFDELDTSPKHYALYFRENLDLILDNGWERYGIYLPTLEPPLPWNKFERSFSCHLHAWEPLSFLLKGSCTVDDLVCCKRYFKASFDYALDWINTFQIPVIDLEPSFLLEKEITESESFAWYDMAVGQRIYRLAYILDTVCRDSGYTDEIVEVLYNSLQFHHRLLSIENFFKVHSNHGLYQALGQLAASKRFADIDQTSASYFILATNRLSQLISEHFTIDNVHKEHSPGYHYMILGSLIGARQTDLITNQEISEHIKTMEKVLTWMIKPNYYIATLGDTDPRKMVVYTERLAQRFENQALQAIISKGKIGSYPRPGVCAYYSAGYAFARLFAPHVQPEFANASYFAQTAGFHSRVHKHADHLSFIWYDKNRDILIDPGRYAYAGRTERGSDLFNQGFWYSDPKRIYCETTRAHNTVEIDGKSFPRKVKPFGSALLYAAEEDGCAVTYCEATHFRTIRHNRLLIMGPGRFLLVLDWLYDRSGTHHDYRQYFHFASEWNVLNENGMISAHHPGEETFPPLDMCVTSLIGTTTLSPVVRGQEEPDLLGWLSDKANSLIPTSCFHFHQYSNEPTSFATLFVFGRTLEVDSKMTRFNRSLSAGQVAWKDQQGSMLIQIQKPKVADVPQPSTKILKKDERNYL
jgi:hypothetical protein